MYACDLQGEVCLQSFPMFQGQDQDWGGMIVYLGAGAIGCRLRRAGNKSLS